MPMFLSTYQLLLKPSFFRTLVLILLLMGFAKVSFKDSKRSMLHTQLVTTFKANLCTFNLLLHSPQVKF